MKTIKLTLKLIHSLPPQSRAYTIQDSVCRGLGVRISPDKRLNYVIHRVVDNRTRTRILAPVSALSVKAARDRAVIQLQAWQAELHQCVITSSPRFDVFVEQTWKPMVFDRWKQGTKETALIALNKRLLPTFGRYPLHTITHKAVQAWFDDVSKTRKGAANRNLDVLLSVFKLALRQGYCERNPASGIKQNKRRVLNRFLSVDEIRRLSRALDEAEKQGQSISQCCDILRLLLLTGCRLSEITYLKGGDVRGNELHLPDSKTGAKVVHIGQAAVKILNNYRCQPNGPLFPMAHKTATSSVQALWLRLRAKAGIEDVRLHDLRHTFASYAVMEGHSIPMVASLLGHKKISMTLRYTHVGDEAALQAAEQIAEVIKGIVSQTAQDIAPKEKPERQPTQKSKAKLVTTTKKAKKTKYKHDSHPLTDREKRAVRAYRDGLVIGL